MDIKDKFIGSLVGLAVGDALGASVEFLKRDSYFIKEYRKGGRYDVLLGEYTDDTAMSLCLCESLILNGFNEANQLELYLKWLECGYMSANNKSIGIGITTYKSLMDFKKNKNTISTRANKNSAGNGSLMRIAPIALYNHSNIKQALAQAALSSYTTHALDICADACMMYAGLIHGALKNLDKDEILSKNYAKWLFGLSKEYKISDEIADILNGSYKEKSRDEIHSTGYVLHSLEASLWCFYNSDTFEKGLILAVNLGDDTDTIGAIYGQLAGAFYGFDSIPKYFSKNLLRSDFIQDMALRLYEKSLCMAL